MKRQSLFTICIVLALLSGFANVSPALAVYPLPDLAPGDIEWVRQFAIHPEGYSGPESGIITLVQDIAHAEDGSGKVYVVGMVCTAPGGPGGTVGCSDGFIRQYDSSGNEDWTRTIVGHIYGVAANTLGVYVVGILYDLMTGNGEGFIRMYDASGNESWTIPSNGTKPIAADASGVYVSEYSSGSNGDFDVIVRKYDADGTEIWMRQFGTSAWDFMVGMTADASGVYVAGYTNGTLPGQASAGGYDAFVRKYDASGNEVWTRQFGSSADDRAVGVSVDASGVYVAGYTNGTLPGQTSAGGSDAFVRKYDASGNEGWAHQFGSSANDGAVGVSVDTSGVYVAGTTSGTLPGQTSAGGSDAFVLRYDTSGNIGWTRQFGTSSEDQPIGVVADATGVYVTGRTSGGFPGQTHTGYYDTFLAKIRTSHPPTVSANGPYSVNEGASVAVTASGNDPEGSPLTYAWDIDNDGTFETVGQSVIFSAANLDGPSTSTINVQVTDEAGLTATAQATVDVLNVAPAATFTSTPATLLQGQSATLSFSNPVDPSTADTAAGFLYSYDCTNDGAFELTSASDASYTCAYPDAGTFNALGRIADKDGGFTDYTVQVQVLTPREGTEGLIDQVQALIPGTLNEGQGNALISKLKAVIQQLDRGKVAPALNQLEAFINDVNADINSGNLTLEEGQPLLDAADAIIASLGG